MRAAATPFAHQETTHRAGSGARAAAIALFSALAASLAGCAAPGGPDGPTPACYANPTLAACTVGTRVETTGSVLAGPRDATLADVYRHRLLTDIAEQKARHLARLAGQRKPDRPLSPYAYAHLRQRALVRKLKRQPTEAGAALATTDVAPGAPIAEETLDTPWRIARRTIFVAPPKTGSQTRTALIGDRDAAALTLTLLTPDRLDAGSAATSLPLTLAGQCDGAVTLGPQGAGEAKQAGELFTGTVTRRTYRAAPFQLELSPSVGQCRITLKAPGRGARETLVLRRRDGDGDGFAVLDRSYAACVMPRTDALTPTAQAFFAANAPASSCGVPGNGPIALLSDPKDGFQAKVEALLGRPLPKGFLAAENPFAPLAMDNAPRLDAILVSALMMKSDFSGQLLGRLLAYHADRGTPVRILVAAPQTLRKDRAFLEHLAAAHPNIALDIQRWHAPPGSGIVDRLSALHKVHHIKALITLGPRERDNVVILGGRNIHDGYLFREPTRLSRWPRLNQYKKGYGTMNPFVYYRDFEVRLTGRSLARSFATQIGAVWNRDADTFMARRPAAILQGTRQVSPAEIAGRTFVRQVVSVPYSDGHALEKLYVDLIDSARHRIDIVTPYLNPPRRIEAAIDRALARGVAIRILTRIDLEGDLAGEILSQVNKRFINRHYDRIAIHESVEDETILHAKLITIDDDLAIVGSVNLNKRSFIHDTENALLVLGKTETARLRGAIDRMDTRTRPVTGRRDVPAIWRAFLAIPAVDKVF